MRIVLGSQSPRRKQLLESLVDNFSIIAPDIDEKQKLNETPLDYSKRITKEKLDFIIEQHVAAEKPALLITSDTIVTIDSITLGKPDNLEHALEMLSALSGKTHQVITGIALCHINNNTYNIKLDTEITQVGFKPLNRLQIESYLSKITFMDKAGSYAFQEYGDTIINNITGSRTNVIGFPLRLFFKMLCELGIEKEVLAEHM